MMYIAGEWTTGSREEAVRSPFDGEVVGVVPVAGAEDAERAVGAAVE
jgi:acyl-CoA reductase-like NAD-dependent aldehyde dehydrogenase